MTTCDRSFSDSCFQSFRPPPPPKKKKDHPIPFLFRGAFKAALKASLQEIRRGQESQNRTAEIRGWKLFLLLRGFCCTDPREGGFVPKKQLQERVDKFVQGIGLQCWRHLSNCLCKEQQPVAYAEEPFWLKPFWIKPFVLKFPVAHARRKGWSFRRCNSVLT